MRPQIRDLLRFIIAAGDGALVPGYADVVFVSVVAHEVVLFVGFVVAGGDAAFADYLAFRVISEGSNPMLTSLMRLQTIQMPSLILLTNVASPNNPPLLIPLHVTLVQLEDYGNFRVM